MLVLKRKGDGGSVNHLAFTPDGSRILTGSPGGSVNGWTAGGEHVWAADARGGVYGLAVTSDGGTVLTAGSRLGAFRAADGAAVAHPIAGSCWAVAVGPGSRVVRSENLARAWSLVESAWPQADGPGGWAVPTATFAGGLAFLSGGGQVAQISTDGSAGGGTSIHVRDAATGAVVRTVHSPYSVNEQVAASADWLAVRAGANVFVWSLADPDSPPVRLLTGSRRHFTGVAFHPSGEYLAATCNDASARVYAAGSWGVVRTFDWKIGRLRSVAFSPDGTLAAAGGDKGQTVVWDFDV